jgi:hypothetical protein
MTGNLEWQDVSADSFPDVAEQFCEFLEACGSLGRDAFVRNVTALLARLYADALLLPDVGDECSETDEVLACVDSRAEVAGAISRLLGVRDCYWEVFDPGEMSEPITTTLSDDLASIYGDLKGGWVGVGSEAPSLHRHSLSHWHSSFSDHWGAHAVDALRALHRLRDT